MCICVHPWGLFPDIAFARAEPSGGHAERDPPEEPALAREGHAPHDRQDAAAERRGYIESCSKIVATPLCRREMDDGIPNDVKVR